MVADDGVPASEKTLAKWKTVEMFKVQDHLFVPRTLNFGSVDYTELCPSDRFASFF